MSSEENIFDADFLERVRKRDLSGIADTFSAGITDSAVLWVADRKAEEVQRAESCWGYQPPKTVPVTWVDMCVWLFNKLGIRSRK